MDVCLLWVLCCQVEVSATSWSLVQRSPTDCGALAHWGLSRPKKNEHCLYITYPRHISPACFGVYHTIFRENLRVPYSKPQLVSMVHKLCYKIWNIKLCRASASCKERLWTPFALWYRLHVAHRTGFSHGSITRPTYLIGFHQDGRVIIYTFKPQWLIYIPTPLIIKKKRLRISPMYLTWFSEYFPTFYQLIPFGKWWRGVFSVRYEWNYK